MDSLHPGAKWIFRLRTYWLFFILALTVGWFITPLIGAFFSIIFGAGIISLLIAGFFVFIILAIIIGEIYASLAYKYFKYDFTKDFLKIERGIIWKRYSNIPYERVQNIDVRRGILARLIGFSEVHIQTAGYSAVGTYGNVSAEGYLPAVSIEDAEKIREFLMKKTGKKQGL